MIQYLTIKNLALIEELNLEFGAGFVTVTGETGAGKSVLLGALSMLSGARIEKAVIGSYGDAAEVQAGLYIEDAVAINEYLESVGLPPCEDNSLLLHRVVHKSKMARISINGGLTTLGVLQSLGEYWIDFHGPGEPQKLFKNSIQLELLDLFANIGKELEKYKAEYRSWVAVNDEIDQLKNTTAISPDELDFLRSQIEQIEKFELTEEAIEQLEQDYNLVERSQEYSESLTMLEESLSGDSGVLSQLATAIEAAGQIVEIDSSRKEFHDRLESLLVEAEDIASELRGMYSSLDMDPESVMDVQSRMNGWLELRRRYGQSLGQIVAKRDSMQKKIDDSSNIEERLGRLENQSAKQKQMLEVMSSEIRVQRKKMAIELSKKVAENLGELGFKKAQLKIEILPEKELKEWGDCYCEFMFSANAGQTVQPLRKIASSGETARVMLAFKTVLAEFDQTPVLVFDEVDANVGGEVGSSVGVLLGNLSKKHQVFCVTHLPQVACQGTEHYLVEKHQDESTTGVEIRPIHTVKKERLTELARMLGDRNSKTAQSMAKELLEKV
jgi:DNA repair protein RecN (Recombination protein N)